MDPETAGGRTTKEVISSCTSNSMCDFGTTFNETTLV